MTIACAATDTRPGLVLDTNASLDWLLFSDPGMNSIRQAIESEQVRWLACPQMRSELAHMLIHPSLARWCGDSEQALSVFDRWVHLCPEPPVAAASSRAPRCSDPDDQVFIDLALAQRARWLVTRDRALLKLARRVRHSVAVVRPADWRGP